MVYPKIQDIPKFAKCTIYILLTLRSPPPPPHPPLRTYLGNLTKCLTKCLAKFVVEQGKLIDAKENDPKNWTLYLLDDRRLTPNRSYKCGWQIRPSLKCSLENMELQNTELNK